MGTWNHIVLVRRRVRVVVDIVVVDIVVVKHQQLNDTIANQVGVGLLLDERKAARGRTRR
jgi:hypothetical protein